MRLRCIETWTEEDLPSLRQQIVESGLRQVEWYRVSDLIVICCGENVFSRVRIGSAQFQSTKDFDVETACRVSLFDAINGRDYYDALSEEWTETRMEAI